MRNILEIVGGSLPRFAVLAFLFDAVTGLAVPDVAVPCFGGERPNIVVILCDDLGYGDLECYGHPVIKTPNLNKLAADGARLTDCYSAAPVCSPSRVGLLTGRSPNRAGVYDWIPEAKSPRPDRRDEVHMGADEVTIAGLLHDAGYSTCMAGKWHCNSKFNDPAQPQPGDFGFDHWMATQNNAAPSHRHPVNFVRNGVAVGPVDEFSCQFVVTEAIGWLKQQDRELPFFLFVPFHEPHEPVASPEPLVEQYRALASSEDEAQYFANVANVDAAVGRLVEALDEMEVRENTLIVFTSDNGPETLNRYKNANRSYGRPGELRGMKLHTTEAGFRVAGIMNWPAKISARQEIRQPVSSLDFLPTFCELAGAALPQDRRLDGASFLPALRGEPIARSSPLVWAYYNALNERRVAMRDGKWKVLAKLDGGKIPRMENITEQTRATVCDAALTDIQIFDLTIDVSESNDLAGQDPQLTERLTRKLNDSYRELATSSRVW